jgi:hypothetical protein
MTDALGTALLLGAAGAAVAVTAIRAKKPNADVHPEQYVYQVEGYRNSIGYSENLRSGVNRKLNEPKAVVAVDPMGLDRVLLPTATAVNPVLHGFKQGKAITIHC